jgi:hypothetical protein
MALSSDEFWSSTPRSFTNRLRGSHKRKQERLKNSWEIARYTAYYTLVPHIEKAKLKPMHKQLPLPWDKPDKPLRKITEEDTRKLLEKWGVKV